MTVTRTKLLLVALATMQNMIYSLVPPVIQLSSTRTVMSPNTQLEGSKLPPSSLFSMSENREYGGDSILSQRNQERVRSSGRRGTKKFVDPGKVFVGGIPFDATEKDVKGFFKENLGHTNNIHSIKIIRDWKTGKSKGYGFVQFTDPMFATCAMEFCKNKMLNGRILTLNQGKKKLDPNTLYIKKKKKKAVDQEDLAIQAGLEQAEDSIDELESLSSIQDFDEADDALLFADSDTADEDFEYDGVFEEIYPEKFESLTEEEQKLNREQRRDVQRRKPRRKLPHKGFESQP